MRQPVYLRTVQSLGRSSGEFDKVEISQLKSVDMASIACWIIDEDEPELVKALVEAIRQHPCPSIYLRGIVLLTDKNINTDDLSQQCVDTCSNLQLFDRTIANELCSSFSSINEWIDKLPKATEHSDINVSFKVLRFIASRKAEMLPVMSAQVHCGYDYPLISPVLENNDGTILEILDFLDERALLTPRFITKTHLCNHCNSAFLNFKEVCPHCRAEEIKAAELIHHFKCAYTGEFSEFSVNNKLQCPKCDMALHHIGVDYDKPSIVFRCAECAHSFQEPEITSTCFSCRRSCKPEDQVAKTISAYSATAIGQNAAIFGLESLFTDILQNKLKLFSPVAFTDFLQIETARIVRYKISNSSLLIMQFPDIEKLQIRLGRRAEEVFIELSAIFKSTLRQSDVISARNESVFFMVLTETALPEAKLVAQRLTDAITQLFKSNLDYSPAIATALKPINKELKVDTLLEEFLEKNVH